MGKIVSVDIPNSVIRAYLKKDDNEKTSVALKRILEKAIPQYFDHFGNFKGFKINFTVPLFLADGKQRVNTFERYAMSISEDNWECLNQAQAYTSLSKKSIAEIVILKELLEGEKGNAENRAVHHK